MIVKGGKSVKSVKPPYLLGLLCLLPLIGAFVGVALILYGVFRYKDKKLILIGSLGLLFTVGVYSLLFYNIRYGKIATESFTRISQRALNNLVIHIESYKTQHGSYPENLEQLQVFDKTIIIEDPFLGRKMNGHKESNFHYVMKGEKYELYSVGKDEVPNTNDDIYPNLSRLDTISAGFVKPQNQ